MKIRQKILETIEREFKNGKHQQAVQDLPFEIQFRLECSWGKALVYANHIRTGKEK